MRTIRRTAAVTLTAVLVSTGLLPTQPAAAGHQRSVSISDSSSYEYSKSCVLQSECNTIFNSVLAFGITVNNRPKPNHPIFIDWELVDVTTTAGADYTGPTSGTITLEPNRVWTNLVVPVVNDGVGEPTETVELHLTGISESIDISDIGVGTIQDGAQIPEDCTHTWIDNFERSLTCTDRPAEQDWHVNVLCVAFGLVGVAVGNTVTGNGTSNARCTQGLANTSSFVLES
jgi:hypothetical protein